jgi:hypothetical protein
MGKRVVVLALAAALGGVGGAAAYSSITPAIAGARLRWLFRHYAAMTAPPRLKPHAGIFISGSPRLPMSHLEEGRKHEERIPPGV